MSAQLDWHVGDDDGERWEPVETLPPPPPPLFRRMLGWVPRWVWYILLAVMIGVVFGSTLVVWRRYKAAQEHLKFQIQGVIDLEAQAFERRDWELFRAQLDARSTQWEHEQRKRLSDSCQTRPQADTPLLDSCYPILPAQVENVELRQDVALVEVIEGDPPVRRVRFYRRTEQGWLHTSPKPDFWQPAIETRYENLAVHSHPRDLPHMQTILDHIAGTMTKVCEMVGCSPSTNLDIECVARRTVDEQLPRFEQGRLLVDTPWLLGIPTEQTLGNVYRTQMADAVVHAVVFHAMGVVDDRPATRLRQAIASEFLIWYSTRDTSSVPLLGRIIDRYGIESLPDVIRSVKEDPSLDLFLSTWLDGDADGRKPKEAAAFFQTVLDIEREAMLAGRRETFRLFQYEPDPDYLGTHRGMEMPQESVFLDIQYVTDFDALPVIRVVSAEIDQNAARVTLALTPTMPAFLPPVEFFYRQDGAWKHSMPYYAQDYGYFLTEQGDDRDRATIRFGCPSWQLPLFARWATQFNEQHPGIYVRVVPVDRLVSQVAGVDTDYEYGYRVMSHVDVALSHIPLDDMVDRRWVYDLESLIAQDADFGAKDFHPGLLERGRINGRIWALPIYADAFMIFYDKDAFDAASVPHPRVGWTQDEFLAAARALTERRADKVIRYGFADASGGMLAFVKSRSGNALVSSTASPNVDLTVPAIVDAVRWYTNLALAHGIMPFPRALGFEQPDVAYRQAAYQLVASRQVAMWSDSTVSMHYRHEQFNLGVVPYPVENQPVNPLHGTYSVMNARTADPQACWLWMVFLTRQYEPYSPQSMLSLPVRHSVVQSADYQAQLQPELAAAIRYILQHSWVPNDADPIRQIYDAVIAVYQGASVEDALARAQQDQN